jgi:formylmethanofuran dehydrogenase subunit B
MGRNRRRPRRIFYVGEAAQGRALKRALPGTTTLSCRRQDYVEVLWSLRALLRGQPELASMRTPVLRALVDAARAADYAVMTWAPGQLPVDHGDIIIETLCEIVYVLNEHTRAAGLALGGNDGATTAMNVCAWQTGYPLRVNFAGGAPEYNPSRNATEALLQRGEADALVWVSAFQPLPPPAVRRMPVIALTPASRRISALAEVHFPVAIPGVESAGTMFRLDGVVGLPLRAVRNTNLPSAAEVLNRIRERL